MYRMRSLECAPARFVPVHEAHIRAFRIRYNKGRKGRFMGVSDIWLTSIVDGRDCWPADGDRYGRACSRLGSATTLPNRAMKLPEKRSVRRVAEMPTISLENFQLVFGRSSSSRTSTPTPPPKRISPPQGRPAPAAEDQGGDRDPATADRHRRHDQRSRQMIPQTLRWRIGKRWRPARDIPACNLLWRGFGRLDGGSVPAGHASDAGPERNRPHRSQD